MLIQRQWLSYRDRVLPKGAPSVQLIECRRAFYAGAQAFYGLLMGRLDHTTDADTVTDSDLSMMESLDGELRAFNEQVKSGVA